MLPKKYAITRWFYFPTSPALGRISHTYNLHLCAKVRPDRFILSPLL